MNEFVATRKCPGNLCDGSGSITHSWEKVPCPYCENESNEELKNSSLDKILNSKGSGIINTKKPVNYNILRELERERDY